MQCIEVSLIEGSTRHDCATPLSVLDLLASQVGIGGVYFFKTMPNVARLRRALTRALDYFPAFSATLTREGDRLYLHHNNAGVQFTLYESSMLINPAVSGPCLGFNSLFEIDANATAAQKASTNAFHLIRFPDNSCALVFHNFNGLADGVAINHFMATWGALYNGRAVPQRKPFFREQINSLAMGAGMRPSSKLHLTDGVASDEHGKASSTGRYGAIHVELPSVLMPEVIAKLQLQADEPLTSSDVIHALIWQAHSKATRHPSGDSCLYTAFDLRHLKELAIPADYDGNAVCERRAVAANDYLGRATVAQVAADFARQVKPVTLLEIKQDIAFLRRELERGAIDAKTGRFQRQLRGSAQDCRVGGCGIYVNYVCAQRTSAVVFENEATWYDLLPMQPLVYAAVYQTQDWCISVHYFGATEHLETFKKALSDSFFQLT